MSDFIPTFGDRQFTGADTYRGQSNLQASPLETAEDTASSAYGTGTTQAGAALFFENQYNTGRMLSPKEQDEQNLALGITGLYSNQPVSQETLSLQQERQKEYLKNKEVMDNGSGFASTAVGSLGIGLGASFLDPFDFAMNFTPGKIAENLGLGAKALMGASIAQRAITRLSQGALDTLPVNVAVGLINWGEASQERRDSGMNDFVKSVAFGSVMGATIHSSTGVLGDVATRFGTNAKIRDILPPNAQTEALQLSNQSVYNFNDILSIQPKVIAAEKFLGRSLKPKESVALLQRELQSFTPSRVNLPKKNLNESGELFSGRTEDFSYLPSDEDLDSINQDSVAQEKVNRLKELINGHNIDMDTPIPKVTLDSETTNLTSDNINGNIDEELTNLEKENADLKQQIKPKEEPSAEGHGESVQEGSEGTQEQPSTTQNGDESQPIESQDDARKRVISEHIDKVVSSLPDNVKALAKYYLQPFYDKILKSSPEEVKRLLSIQRKANVPEDIRIADDLKNRATVLNDIPPDATEAQRKSQKDYLDKIVNAQEVRSPDLIDIGEGHSGEFPDAEGIVVDFGGNNEEIGYPQEDDEKHLTAKLSEITDKLQEANVFKRLPRTKDLKDFTSSDHLTSEDLDKLDKEFGKDNWILKPAPYGDALQGKGVYLAENVRKLINGETVKYNVGYGDADGGNPEYTQEQSLDADLKTHGKYIVQQRIPIAGETKAIRESGRTIIPGEFRVHVITKDGKAYVPKGSTWLKGAGEGPDVVHGIDTPESLAAEKEALVTIESATDKSHLQGQTYGVDVVRTTDGELTYRAVEVNPTAKGGDGIIASSGLGDTVPTMDALVSHHRGELPFHAKAGQDLLDSLVKDDKAREETTKAKEAQDKANDKAKEEAANKVTLPEMIDHIPDYPEEIKGMIDASEAQVTEADKQISELSVREQAIRNATDCFLNA